MMIVMMNYYPSFVAKFVANFLQNITLLATLIAVFQNQTVRADEFSYHEQQNWANNQNQCDGMNQSPIDIKIEDVEYNNSLTLFFQMYDNPSISFTAVNNAHSVQFDYIGDMSSAPTISGSALNNAHFKLAQFHFHWGSTIHIGSEHRINGRPFPVEMHLVHFNQEKYHSFSDALQARDGSVAVVGVFFEVQTHNIGFEVVSNMIADLQHSSAQQKTNLKDFIVLQDILPKNVNHSDFFRYHGSLTTPPCTEGIIWLVLHKPGQIGRSQFEKFLGVVSEHTGEKLVNNYRWLQKLNGRKVESSFDVWDINRSSETGNSSKGFWKTSASHSINNIIFVSVVGLMIGSTIWNDHV